MRRKKKERRRKEGRLKQGGFCLMAEGPCIGAKDELTLASPVGYYKRAGSLFSRVVN
jgi:hypothetical protein